LGLESPPLKKPEGLMMVLEFLAISILFSGVFALIALTLHMID